MKPLNPRQEVSYSSDIYRKRRRARLVQVIKKKGIVPGKHVLSGSVSPSLCQKWNDPGWRDPTIAYEYSSFSPIKWVLLTSLFIWLCHFPTIIQPISKAWFYFRVFWASAVSKRMKIIPSFEYSTWVRSCLITAWKNVRQHLFCAPKCQLKEWRERILLAHEGIPVLFLSSSHSQLHKSSFGMRIQSICFEIELAERNIF